ncbi:unnamed protein product [Arabidopsis lyrata]|nr:unnamed protein product [Arabidopsis lyrata]
MGVSRSCLRHLKASDPLDASEEPPLRRRDTTRKDHGLKAPQYPPWKSRLSRLLRFTGATEVEGRCWLSCFVLRSRRGSA